MPAVIDPSSTHSRIRQFGWLPLIAPAWLVLGLLLLLPLCGIFWMSLLDRDDLGDPVPVHSVAELWERVRSGQVFDNYRHGLSEQNRVVFYRSLWMAALTTGVTVLVSYPVAYFIAVMASKRLRALLTLLTIVPFWTSFVIRTYAWVVLLRAEGVINVLLMKLGIVHEPLGLLYNGGSVLVGLVYGELPFMILPLYASMEKIDRSLLEAARDLGGGALAAFWRVVVPLSVPGLAAGCILVFVPAVGQFIVSDMLGGNRFDLLGNLIERQFQPHGTIGNRPYGAALTVELVLLVLLLVTIYQRRWRSGGELA